jgi:hypothetical protein
MRYLEAILGILRSAGFSVDYAAHAFWLLDSYVYGHVVQETNLSRSGSAETAALAGPGFEPDFGGDYPHLAEPQSAPSAPHSASMASSSTVSSLS